MVKEESKFIDMVTFGQILEMDEEDDHDFSKGIVFNFFDQVEDTIQKMESFMYEYRPSVPPIRLFTLTYSFALKTSQGFRRAVSTRSLSQGLIGNHRAHKDQRCL